MFITGPDVVKTVTGEEVTLEELGGAMSHASKSGVATFVVARREGVPRRRALPARRSCRRTTSRSRRTSRPATTPSGSCPELRDLMPASPNQPYDMKKVIAAVVDDGEFFEYFPHWAQNIVCGFARLDGQPVGIVGNQPMVLAGVLDIESLREGGPLRAHLRRLQHPARHLRRRARLPARRRPGVRRHHPPRRQAALRLLRGDRAPHPDHHPQGLRRRLRRHELEVDRRRPGLRLAVGRAGGDGPAGRGRDRLPPRAAAGRRPRRPGGPSWSTSTPSSTPTRTTPPSGATSTT